MKYSEEKNIRSPIKKKVNIQWQNFPKEKIEKKKYQINNATKSVFKAYLLQSFSQKATGGCVQRVILKKITSVLETHGSRKMKSIPRIMV